MNFRKLLQPKLNPFRLFIYSQKDRSISIKTLPPEKISFYKLSQLNSNLTYCNSYSDLFISDGNDFWVINHSTYQIRRKKMPIQKKNFSLVFVPSFNSQVHEGKIFVVGGDNKKTFYFDLKKNYFINWAQTNELHNNPALIQMGDYLYIFDGFKNNQIIFERSKLTDNKKEWEKIIPNYDQDILRNFPSDNFATSIDSKGNILFIGGNNINMENNNTYIYDINQNKIYLSEKGTNDNMNFIDKSFYLIDNQYSVALPEGLEENREIAIVDKREQSLIKTNIGEIVQSARKIKNELLQKNLNDDFNTKKENIVRAKIIKNYDAPKEFGYFVSSFSSEQAKIKAKNDKIQIIEINKNISSINNNVNEAKIQIESEINKEKEKIQIEENYVDQKIEEQNANQNIEQQIEQNIEEKQEVQNIEEPVEQNIEQNVEEKILENVEQIQSPEYQEQVKEENNENIEQENIAENKEEEQQHLEENQEANQEKVEEEAKIQQQEQEQVQEPIPEQKNINIIEYEEINTDVNPNQETINNIQEPEEINKIKEEQNVEQEEVHNDQQEEHYEEHIEPQKEENVENIEPIEQKHEEEIGNEKEQEYNIEQEQIENNEEHEQEHIENGGEMEEVNIEEQQENININGEENVEAKENQEVKHVEEENINLQNEEENHQEQPQEHHEQENIEQKPEVKENKPQEENHENNNEVDIEKLNKQLDDLIERKMKEEIRDLDLLFVKSKSASLKKEEEPIKKETNIEIVEDNDHIKIQMQNELEFNNAQIQTESQKEQEHEQEQENEQEREQEQEQEQEREQEREQEQEQNGNMSGEENVVENEEQMEENNENEYYEGEEGNIEEEHLENNEEGEEMNFEEEDNEEENGENEYMEEQGEERDTFQKTLTQNIGEDVMQIPEQPAILYYDQENFCDYKP